MLKEILMESMVKQITIYLEEEYSEVENCAENAMSELENILSDYNISYDIDDFFDEDTEIIFDNIKVDNSKKQKLEKDFTNIKKNYKCIYNISFN